MTGWIGLIALLVELGLCGAGLGLFGWQVFQWARTGAWAPYSVADLPVSLGWVELAPLFVILAGLVCWVSLLVADHIGENTAREREHEATRQAHEMLLREHAKLQADHRVAARALAEIHEHYGALQEVLRNRSLAS